MKTKTKAKILTGVITVATLASLPFILAGCKPEPEEKPKPVETAPVMFGDKPIPVDYTNSGLTQAQADTVTPKLQEIFGNFSSVDPNSTDGARFTTMVNKPGFKIVIIPGNSGCARSGDNMTLGANFVLTNDADGIGGSIGPAIFSDLFAKAGPVQGYAKMANVRDGITRKTIQEKNGIML
jgi:hypothetical protein